MVFCLSAAHLVPNAIIGAFNVAKLSGPLKQVFSINELQDTVNDHVESFWLFKICFDGSRSRLQLKPAPCTVPIRTILPAGLVQTSGPPGVEAFTYYWDECTILHWEDLLT